VLHRRGRAGHGAIGRRGRQDDRVDEGDLVLLVGFGAGMTAASALLRWGGTTP